MDPKSSNNINSALPNDETNLIRLKVKTKDDQLHEYTYGTLRLVGLIKDFIENTASKKDLSKMEIPIPELEAEEFELCMEWCAYHKGRNDLVIQLDIFRFRLR